MEKLFISKNVRFRSEYRVIIDIDKCNGCDHLVADAHPTKPDRGIIYCAAPREWIEEEKEED